MADFRQHRDEIEDYSEDFTARLVSGETLSAPVVTFWTGANNSWTDKSADFEAPAPATAVDGRSIDYTIDPKTTVVVGTYRIRVEVTTSLGRALIETPTIEIHAAPDA